MAPEQQTDRHLGLPTLVFGPAEVRRLMRELEALDEYLSQAALRQGGAGQSALPKLSRLLDDLASENQANLLHTEDRSRLAEFLKQVHDQSPIIHISFASDPSSAFMAKVVGWLRENIHPLVLVKLGLQPSIAAGCIMRTANRSFDFSLRHRFEEQRRLILQSLESPS